MENKNKIVKFEITLIHNTVEPLCNEIENPGENLLNRIFGCSEVTRNI